MSKPRKSGNFLDPTPENYSTVQNIILDDIDPDPKTKELLEKIEQMVIYVDFIDKARCRIIKEAAGEILGILDGPCQGRRYGKVSANFRLFPDGDPDKVPVVRVGSHKEDVYGRQSTQVSIQNRDGNDQFMFVLPLRYDYSCRYELVIRSFVRKISKAISDREDFISLHGHEVIAKLDAEHQKRIDLVTNMLIHGMLVYVKKEKTTYEKNMYLYFHSKTFGNPARFLLDGEDITWPQLSNEAQEKWVDELPIMASLTNSHYGLVELKTKLIELGKTSKLADDKSESPMEIISLHNQLPKVEDYPFVFQTEM